MGEAEGEAEGGVGKCADRLSRRRYQVAATRGHSRRRTRRSPCKKPQRGDQLMGQVSAPTRAGGGGATGWGGEVRMGRTGGGAVGVAGVRG